MKANSLVKTVYSVNPKTIVSVCAVMLLIFSIQGIGYGAPPEFPSDTTQRSLEENTRVGVSIGLPVRATDPERDRLTYELSGTDLTATIDGTEVTLFEIAETTGRLRTAYVLDYENPLDTDATGANAASDNTYVVTVTAEDPDGGSDIIVVTITVTDRNEAPMFTDEDEDTAGIQIDPRPVPENSPEDQGIGAPVGATDPDADATVTTDPDTAQDTNPNTNADDDLIYTHTGPDARFFEIDDDTGQLKVKTVLDYENPQDTGGDNAYTVVVIVSDSASGGLSARVTVTITVTDVDEAPEFLLGPNNAAVTRIGRTVPENARIGTSIGDPVMATDPDGDTLTYIVSDTTNFLIESNGQLKTLVKLDHETQPSHTVIVTATDDQGDTDATNDLANTIAVTITVTDANDAPMFTDEITDTPNLVDAPRSVAENRGGVPVGLPVRATDLDGDSLTYRVTDLPGRNDAASFTIDNTGQLRTTAAGLNYEAKASYTVKVTATDPDGSTDEITVNITVTDVNEAPAFTYDTALNRLYVYEGGSGLTVMDPEGEIKVTDPDADPTVTTDPDTDADTNPGNPGVDSLSYELSGPDAATFAISAAGQLTTDAILAYATAKRVYTVTIIVRDSAVGTTGSLSDIITVSIRLVEVTVSGDNTAPVFVEGVDAFTVMENASSLLIGHVRARDANGDTLTYSLGGSDAGLFNLDIATGELYSKESLDHEAAPTRTVTVTASDGTGTTDQSVTITVTDVNEKPVFVTSATDSIPIMSAIRPVNENENVDTAVGDPLVIDDPEDKNVIYSLSGTDAGSFAIIRNTDGDGQLQTRAKLDYETKSTYEVMVTADDGDLKSDPITVTISVTDRNDPPMFADDRITRNIPEDTGIGVNIGMPVVAMMDEDGDSLTYSLATGDDNALFAIRRFGQLYSTTNLAAQLDYEGVVTGSKSVYTITVQVIDGKAPDGSADTTTVDDTITVSVIVTDVNEAPMFADDDADPATPKEAARTVPENTMANQPIGEPVEATDPEDDTLVYSLGDVPGRDDRRAFGIDPMTGQLKTMAPLDVETKASYEVMVRVTDRKNRAGTSDSMIDDEIKVTITVGPVNEPPMFTEGDTATRSIPENMTAGEFGAPLVVMNPEGTDDTLGYTLTVPPGANPTIPFSIADGQLSSTAELDYEMTSSYTVIVQVNDGVPDTTTVDDEITVTITVTNVNEAPTFGTVTDDAYVYEGAAGKTVYDPAGELKATDPDVGDTLTYRLSGDGARSFRINSRTGQITSTAALDDADDDYTVTVSATDRGGLSASTEVDIGVVAVTAADNAKPTFATGAINREVDEGPATDTGGDPRTVGAVVIATDTNTGDTLTYTLGGTDRASFDIGIRTGQLTTKVALDREKKATYTVTVTANDGTVDSDAKTVTITVTDVAESPVFTEGERTTRMVNENTPADQNIGARLLATDSDGDSLSYTLGGPDVALFAIVAATGQLRTAGELDYEAAATREVTVTAVDGDDTTTDPAITVTIIVKDVNDKPAFVASAGGDIITSATRAVVESAEVGTDLGTTDDPATAAPVLAEDDDMDPLTYTVLGTDRGSFDIDSTGQLKTAVMLDYETKRAYSVTVRVEDGRGGRAEIPVAISVTNAATPFATPMFATASLTRKVAENAADDATVGDPVVIEADTEVGTPTYSVADYVLGSGDVTPFDIEGTSGQLTVDGTDVLDYEKKKMYVLKVTATAGTRTDTVKVTITVTDVDEDPAFLDASGDAITTAARSVAENTPANRPIGLPLVATDPDKKSLTYTLDGTDKASFNIDSTGQLKTKVALDHETTETYTVTVKAKDPGDNEAEITTVTITVIDIAEPPMFTEGNSATRSVQEGEATERSVGAAFSATDPDDGDTLTYTLSGPDAASFTLSNTQQLETNSPLDYEAVPIKRTYRVTIVATDSGGLTDSITVTINVENIEELPMFPVTSTSSPYVYEEKINAKVFDPDGHLMATDGDKDKLTYTHTGTDVGSFNINSGTGQLTAKAALDYEAKTTYDVRITATDTKNNAADIDVTINVKNVTEEDNTAPVFVDENDDPITTVSFETTENAADLFIGQVEALDDNGDDVTYTIGGRDQSFFTIGLVTGQLSSKKSLDFDTRPQGYRVEITATDGKAEDRLSVTVTLTNVNEPPMFHDADGDPITSATLSIKEGTGVRNVGMVLARDPDGDPLTYTLDAISGTLFSIVRTSTGGQLRTKGALDYEDQVSHTVEVSVSDSKDDEGMTDAVVDDRITVTVTVTNVNEPPMFLDANGDSIATATRKVKEKQAGGTTVGAPVKATDPENDSLTYTLGGANVGSFAIDANGQLTTRDALAAGTNTVVISVSDGKNVNGDEDAAIDDTITVTITIEAVETTNNAPVFPATETGARAIDEGEATGRNVGAPVTATDADDDTLTYTIGNVPGSTDAESFDIDPSSGQLTTMEALDYEGKPVKRTYSVTVTATDDDTENPFADTITVTITVTDVNEKPTFPDPTDMLYVYEGNADQTVFDPDEELKATDPEMDTLTYGLVTGTGLFNIDTATGQLTTKVALDYDGDPAPQRTYTVTVSVSDGKNADGGTDTTVDATTTVDIALKDVTEENNNAPRFIASAATADTAITQITREVVEHVGDDMAAKTVGDEILAKDDDTGTTLSYTLGGADADSFTIASTADGVQLNTAVALDYDGDAPKRSYAVTITVSDGALEATISVTISVMNDTSDDTVANNEPTFVDGDSTTRSVVENAVNANVGLPVSATDGDNDPLTYTLDATSEATFSIDSNGQLTTDIELDFEGTQVYTVTVNVSDGKDAEGTAQTITTVDDSITVTINVTNDTADDGADPDPTQNNPPRFTGSTTRSIQAGTGVRNVGSRVTATDPEGDTLTYALTGGHTALFGINSSTGQLSTRAAVTAGSYSVTVTVHDGKATDGSPSNAVDATIVIRITVTTGTPPDTGGGQPPAPQPLPPGTPGTPGTPAPVTNDPPVFDDGTSATRSVAENTPAGTNIGAPVGATDPNNDPLTYTLGGADAASFGINGTSGQLMTSAALDFEVKRVYTVTVTANDGLTGGTASIPVTINVTDVSVAEGDPVPTNTAPAFASETTTRSVAENTAAGGTIGAPVAAVDADTGEVLTYTLGGADAASFGINAATGQLMTQAALDHETKASYTVVVTATDKGGLTDSISVTITVTDVNEAPAFASATAERSVAENTAADMAIGDAFTATDPDDGDEVTYSVGGTDAGSFAVDSATGQLKTMGMLDHETKASHIVMVIATDSGGLTGSITVTISVMDVNDPPRFASATAERMVEENTAAGIAIGAPVTAMDDDGDDVTYSLGGADMASFAIDTATGQLKTMADLDYEAKTSHTVTVTASDGTLTSSVTVTIMVTDVPEFMLSVPSGQSLIHVPLKMAGLAKISDLYDKLGGATNVNLLITYDATSQRWLSYTGDRNRGQIPDKNLTDDLGILADMKNAVTLQLSGDALGTDGTASITLQAGSNLVGVPLKDSRITNVSDLLGLEDSISFIIVADGGEYKTITRAGDPGDVAVTGGQAFILNATEAATITITGDGWASSAASSAPSWMSRIGVQKDGMTAALAVTGSIVDEVKGLTDFHITVKNLSTGKVDTVATDANGAGYQLTFVDIETGRAAQIGDTLEITARAADPLVGVEPLRYVVTVEDVKRGHIQLDTLVTYEVPAKTELLRNYPNPFNPETWIPYRLAKAATVTLTIYNQNGGVVRELHLGHQIAAVYETRSKAIYWDGRNNLGERVASGIYFYHLTAGDYSAVRKMVIVK